MVTQGLVCSRCGKSFEKESSYKRHGYYCRTKPIGHKSSRKRSCTACARAKSKCDQTFPHCSTCIARKIDCEYDGAISTSITIPESSAAFFGTTSTANEAVEVASSSEPLKTTDLDLQDASASGDLITLDDIEVFRHDTQLYSGTGINTLQFPESLFDIDSISEPMNFQDKDSISSCLGFVVTNPNDLFSTSNHPCGEYVAFHSPIAPHIPPVLSQSDTSRSIVRREMAKPHAQTSAMLLFRVLAAFPEMMLRKDTFPPFIHYGFFSTTPGKEGELPEPLINCITLARMFKTRTKESSKFLWRTIRMEHERLWLEHGNFSDLDLLAAVQALLIYTVMRVVEGDTEHNGFDVPLLLSINAIASQLSINVSRNEYELKDVIRKPSEDWRSWIFHEMRRRVVVMARIMNMLVNIDHALACTPLAGFALIPLPAKKALWEAVSATEWYKEFDAELKAREIFALTTEGGLVRLQQRSNGITTTPTAWEEWYATSDGFGMLVMLAASILKKEDATMVSTEPILLL